MKLICYPLLCTDSRKAILRQSKNVLKSHRYSPKGDLLQRLAKKLGWNIDRVAEQLHKEREYLLKQESRK